MHCKLCNTRISPGERTCPNCGADVRGMSGSHPAPAARKVRPTSLPPPGSGSGLDSERELPLEDVAGRSHPGITSPGGASGSGRRSPAPAAPAPGTTAMGTASLRALLADQPELLEPGLRVYRDESGAPAGVQFPTGVGAIDLLATDARGNLVAVIAAEKGRSEEELVAEVLQRVGWLRKHLCAPQKQVRAIVLVEDPPASLPYTVAAVAETLCFKTFRVALVFEDIEI
jgi:hypothetical protein